MVKSFADVEHFLKDNKLKIIKVANTNECRKWSKWLSHNETPFPCVCPTRNKDCIFAEVYYKMTKVAEASNFQDECEEALLNYHIIKNDSGNIGMWLNQYARLHTKIKSFNNHISITVSINPYKTLNITVDFPLIVNDFKAVYRDVTIKIKESLSFLNIFPIRTEYSSLEMQCRHIKKDTIRGYRFDIYKYSSDLIHGIYGVEPISKPLLYFNANVLSRVDYRFDVIHYKHLMEEINKELPISAKLGIEPLNNYKSTFYQHNDIGIHLLQLDSSTMTLRVSDYWQFYN